MAANATPDRVPDAGGAGIGGGEGVGGQVHRGREEIQGLRGLQLGRDERIVPWQGRLEHGQALLILTTRQRLEASHWFSLWWGTQPAETQDEAVERAFAGFLDKITDQASRLGEKGKRGPQVVARVPPNLKGKAIAVMPLRAGSGLLAATAGWSWA